jgi:hypothetical protein
LLQCDGIGGFSYLNDRGMYITLCWSYASVKGVKKNSFSAIDLSKCMREVSIENIRKYANFR